MRLFLSPKNRIMRGPGVQQDLELHSLEILGAFRYTVLNMFQNNFRYTDLCPEINSIDNWNSVIVYWIFFAWVIFRYFLADFQASLCWHQLKVMKTQFSKIYAKRFFDYERNYLKTACFFHSLLSFKLHLFFQDSKTVHLEVLL